MAKSSTTRKADERKKLVAAAEAARLWIRAQFPECRFFVRIVGQRVSVILASSDIDAYKCFREWTPDECDRWEKVVRTEYRYCSAETLATLKHEFVPALWVRGVYYKIGKFLDGCGVEHGESISLRYEVTPARSTG